MTVPDKLRRDLERRLPGVLSAVAHEIAVFPLEVPLPEPSPTLDHLQARTHQESLRDLERLGVLRWEARSTRKLGSQTWPVRVAIPDLRILGKLLDRPQLARFPCLARAVMNRLPNLKSWWNAHPLEAWELRGSWGSLVHALLWFQLHPFSGLHPREIPWRLHGKFIEENRRILDELLGELFLPGTLPQSASFEERWGLRTNPSLVRVRLEQAEQSLSGLPSDDLAMSLEHWIALPSRPSRALVVENLATFLACPLREFRAAVWGQGFAVVAMAEWLRSIPEVLYWGDLDAQGFEILDRLRAACPAVRSWKMDFDTFRRHGHLSCAGTPSPLKDLEHLTREEWDIYRHLVRENLRLEQEKLPLW